MHLKVTLLSAKKSEHACTRHRPFRKVPIGGLVRVGEARRTPVLRLLTLPLALPRGRLLPVVTKRVSCVSPLVVSLLFSCKLSTHVNTQRKRVLPAFPCPKPRPGDRGATAAASPLPGSLLMPGLPCIPLALSCEKQLRVGTRRELDRVTTMRLLFHLSPPHGVGV